MQCGDTHGKELYEIWGGHKDTGKSEDEVDIKLSAYDIAVQQMNQLAANTMGFYSTTVAQKTVPYLHTGMTSQSWQSQKWCINQG